MAPSSREIRPSASSFVLALVVLLGCSSKGGEDGASASASASASAAMPKSPMSSTASASASAAATAGGPSPVDLSAKKWVDGATTLELETKDLSKTCLLKGISLMLPAQAKIKPLMGTRGCTVYPFGDDGPYLFIVNDELNFKLKPKEELKGVKRVVEETADSWLIEDENPKTGFAGRVTRKLGDRTVWCAGNTNGKPNGEQIGRGLVKLCSTIAYTAPAK
jgi:hypothetical protein